jgi:tetratricopeptide (TPR) repeat protein
MLAGSRRCAVLLVLLGWWSAAGVARGAPAGEGGRPSAMELQAREAFAVGDYSKAVGLFAKLYAETLHPTYLRNIGRCHQNLGDPDRAIGSFREYLRKARDLSAGERAEINGYIEEMQALQRQRADAAKPIEEMQALQRQRAEAAKPKEAPAITRTPAPPPPAAIVVAPVRPDAPPAAEARPAGRRWWLWTALGAVALGAAGVTAALVLGKPSNAPCPPGKVCYHP